MITMTQREYDSIRNWIKKNFVGNSNDMLAAAEVTRLYERATKLYVGLKLTKEVFKEIFDSIA